MAVVGMGAVTAAGAGLEALLAALEEGRRCFGPARFVDLSQHPSQLVAEVPLDEPELAGRLARKWVALGEGPPPPSQLLGRFPPPGPPAFETRSERLSALAIAEALATAGLAGDQARPWRRSCALLVGGSAGAMREAERWRAQSLAEAARGDAAALERYSLTLLRSQPIGAAADALGRALHLEGPRLTLNTACSSSANALLLGAWMIRRGQAERVIAGGVEALSQLTQTGFAQLGLIDPFGCRPFDRDRRGLTLGEGAAFVVLEALDSARRRGARVRALLEGGAIAGEAYHPTAPEPSGQAAAQVMTRALTDAGLGPDAIDYVNAHGTGTPANDLAETRALHAALLGRAPKLPVSSSKSMLGHCLGAAGAIEAVVTVLALEQGFVPPTAGLLRPDPLCDLDYVPSAGRRATLRAALSNSFGFGGNLTALVLARGEPAVGAGEGAR